jgi:hypothetical protein
MQIKIKISLLIFIFNFIIKFGAQKKTIINKNNTYHSIKSILEKFLEKEKKISKNLTETKIIQGK